MLKIKAYTLIEVLIFLTIFFILTFALAQLSNQVYSLVENKMASLRLQQEVNLAGEVVLANLKQASKIERSDDKLYFLNQSGEEKEIYINQQGLYLDDEQNLISQYINELSISSDNDLIYLELVGELKQQQFLIATAFKNEGVLNE